MEGSGGKAAEQQIRMEARKRVIEGTCIVYAVIVSMVLRTKDNTVSSIFVFLNTA